MANSHSGLDDFKDIIQKRQGRYSNREIVNLLAAKYAFKTSEKSLRRAYKRWASEDQQPELIEATSEVSDAPVQPEQIITEFGLDPDEWDVVGGTVNKWGSPEAQNYQIKARIVKRTPVDFIMPAVESPSFIHNGNFKPPEADGTELAVFISDEHAPFNDKNFHRVFCDWLAFNKPQKGFSCGDLGDYSEISRHRHKPEYKASTQTCINAGYNILLDRVTASKETKWVQLFGNHDIRIATLIIDHVKDLIDVRQADVKGAEQAKAFYSLSNLLRLDSLGIECIEPLGGNYEHSKAVVTPKLAAIHGWKVRPKSGGTAISTLEHVGHSIVFGHVHRAAQVYQTKFDIYGELETLMAAELGCACDITVEGLGYSPSPDWQNAGGTAVLFPDGTFHYEPIIYVANKLMWRDQVFI